MEILPTYGQVNKRAIKQIIKQITTVALSSPTLCKCYKDVEAESLQIL